MLVNDNYKEYEFFHEIYYAHFAHSLFTAAQVALSTIR